jgi:hypothetical protein
MGMSKRARNVASITNRTTTFGIMGGLAPRSRIAANQSAIRNKARNQQTIPLKPVPGLNYMKGNNPMGRVMLSRNPQCSGGVGRTSGGGFAGCSPANNVSASFLAGGGGGSSMMIAHLEGADPANDTIWGATQTFGTLVVLPTPPTGALTPDSSTVVYFANHPGGGGLVIIVNNVNITGGRITISGVTTPSYGPYTNDIEDATAFLPGDAPGYKGFAWPSSLPVNPTNGETYRITYTF